MSEAAKAEAIPRGEGGPFGDGRDALWGLPISVKDCFDLAGAPTSCGVRFYRDLHGAATKDSWLVERLRAAGAVITGKTHLHPSGLRHHGRESGVRRLRAAGRRGRADGRVFFGCGCKRARGLGCGGDRDRYRRVDSRTCGALRAGGLSRVVGPRRLARRCAPGAIVRHDGVALSRSGRCAAAGRPFAAQGARPSGSSAILSLRGSGRLIF